MSWDGLKREDVTQDAPADALPSPQQSDDDHVRAEIPKPGALVTLITGGPDMAIKEVISSATGRFTRLYLCQHFEGAD